MYLYSSGLTKQKARSLANKLATQDKKLRKLGGSGNYEDIEVTIISTLTLSRCSYI